MELPDARYYALKAQRAVVAPSPLGAHNWQAMSYHPGTGLVYFTALDTPTPMEITSGSGGLVGGSLHIDWLAPLSDKSRIGRLGKLIAWDPLKQKAMWSVNLERPMNGGVLSTAGDLVFLGAATGEIKAYHARTG
ncbi:MAG: pyrrolo-quinoline quinone, partial [Proteobacteria bacterium]|nr:pyrrolo-quinoline quinone [Pseudomonadota bacterium]